MKYEHGSDKAKSAHQQLRQAIENVADLDAEERLRVFEDLFGAGGDLSDMDVPFLSDGMGLACHRNRQMKRSFDRASVKISNDGRIVLRPPNVFLSHNHADKRFVRFLADKLRLNDISVWFDEAELNFGDSLIEKLRDAIDSVDVLLAIISRESAQSAWVQKEIEIAMTQEIQQKRVKVIPIVLDNVDLPGFLVGKVYADFTSSQNRTKNLPKLVESIVSHAHNDRR